MNSVLLIGATSDIAKACAESYAKQGVNLILAGRNLEKLKLLCNDYQIRFDVKASPLELDVIDIDTHESIIDSITELPSTTLVFAGYLGDQEVGQRDLKEAKYIMDANYTGIVTICNVIANRYETQKDGAIVVLSSVAGERGRQSNYLYGSAKAGLTAYLSGLRNRLSKSNVHVMTVLPGFMATKMTEELNLPRPLTAQPDEVAKSLMRAITKKKDVVYIKWIWKYIMLVIRNIPEGIFKKLSL